MAQRLTELAVYGFRALNRFEVPNLADVNLFVGKNSTGKTTLLEAIRLVMAGDIRPRLYSLLADRDEYSFRRWQNDRQLSNGEALEVAFEALFYGRPELWKMPGFEISGGAGQPRISIRFVWLRVERNEDASVRYFQVHDEDMEDAIPGFEIEREPGIKGLLPLDRFNRVVMRRQLRDTVAEKSVFLASSGMTPEEIGEMWDGVALTDDEDEVVEALRIIAPTLEKLVMVQSPEGRGAGRMLMAKVSTFQSPIPFKSLGEGATHLLSVTLALIKARGGTLLIDEVANGIHYSVQPALWKIIFAQAAHHQIQVFATTHSLDCVRALHRADEGVSDTVGALFRLESVGDQIKVVSFNAREIAIIDEDEIEVR